MINQSAVIKERQARQQVAAWISMERTNYADRKYEPGDENYMARLADICANGIGPESTEMVFLSNYLKRAELLGIDNPAGRQAFGKFVVTAIAMLERIVVAYGDMPRPGLTTGEVHPWQDGPQEA